MAEGKKNITDFVAQTIRLPEGIKVDIKGNNTIALSGTKGTLERTFKSYRIKISAKGNEITVTGKPNNKSSLVMMKSVLAHIKNMTEGLLYGYKHELKIVYSHFPMTASVDKTIVLIKNYLGEKFPRKSKIIGSTKVEIKGQDITVSGIDKEEVGQTSGNLELATKVRGKDIRRFQDGIYLVASGNITERKEPLFEIVRGN